jgi:hypothetical protein
MISMLAVATLFTSCNKDEDNEDKRPTLNFIGGDGYTSTSSTITLGEEILVGWNAFSNTSTSKKLSHFEARIVTIGMEDQLLVNEDINGTSYSSESFSISASGAGVFDIKATVTDNAGETRTVSITITVEEATNPDTPLTEAEDFTWNREGSAAGTGLSQFGLKWTSNAKEVKAKIIKDNATKLVNLGSSAWTTITTQEALIAAIDAATDMEAYHEVSAEANHTYDDVIGTIVDGTYYMIHVTSGTVANDISTGTAITITGQYKK